MCLFCENYGYCIASIEKNQVDVLCAVGELSAKEEHFVYSKSPLHFLEKQEEQIPGPRTAAGWCLCFGPGRVPVAHTGCGTVRGPTHGCSSSPRFRGESCPFGLALPTSLTQRIWIFFSTRAAFFFHVSCLFPS